MPENKLLIVVLGPTASGKTDLSVRLAAEFGTEIVSADSRQFFREMTIGTAKPNESQLSEVKHHFINTHSACSEYNAFDYEKDAINCINDIHSRSSSAILTGGSGLYLHAVLEGIDETIPPADPALRQNLNEIHKQKGIEGLREILEKEDPGRYSEIDTSNPARLIRAIEICRLSGTSSTKLLKKSPKKRPFNILKIGIERKREELYERINQRVDDMMSTGLEDEARSLVKWRNKNALRTVGYQELFRYFDGEISRDEAVRLIRQNSRRYAKRQLTWFKRYPDIQWFRIEEYDKIVSLIRKHLSEKT